MEVFRYQFEQVPVYRQFCELSKKHPDNVKCLSDIPFLPIALFKTRKIIAAEKKEQKVFESSGTTGAETSKHYVADLHLYERSFIQSFRQFYGDPEDYVILALLPSYLERRNSSLVFMVERLITLSKNETSGFYLNEFVQLNRALLSLKEKKQKTILLGVTFALMDFAGLFRLDFPELIVMETGGMKGRREELVRAEVHEQLATAFGVQKIHSEYGMTELLSQAYSKGDGLFQNPPWMKVLIRDVYDPMTMPQNVQRGAINVIDLANLYSCSFIATSDLGRMSGDNAFEVLGRVDNAEIRGCNLLVTS